MKRDQNLNDSLINMGLKKGEAPSSFNYLLPVITKILGGSKFPRKILDIGCGNGALADFLSKTDNLVGIEPYLLSYEMARCAYPLIKFYNFGLEDDPNKILQLEGKFDICISTEVVEHLYFPRMLPIFAKAVLNDNGFFIISTPYHGYLKNLLLSIFGYWDKHLDPLWDGGHIKIWSKKTLTILLQQNGFRVIKFYGAGRFPFLWKSIIVVSERC